MLAKERVESITQKETHRKNNGATKNLVGHYAFILLLFFPSPHLSASWISSTYQLQAWEYCWALSVSFPYIFLFICRLDYISSCLSSLPPCTMGMLDKKDSLFFAFPFLFVSLSLSIFLFLSYLSLCFPVIQAAPCILFHHATIISFHWFFAFSFFLSATSDCLSIVTHKTLFFHRLCFLRFASFLFFYISLFRQDETRLCSFIIRKGSRVEKLCFLFILPLTGTRIAWKKLVRSNKRNESKVSPKLSMWSRITLTPSTEKQSPCCWFMLHNTPRWLRSNSDR